jgi:hypothetical protein
MSKKKCNELPYTKEKEQAFNISLESWYCLDFDNITLGGNWDGNFVYGIELFTKQCDENKNCSSNEEIKNFFSTPDDPKKLFYSDLSLDVYPSMDNFEHPLKTNLVNRYEILSLSLSKRKVQTYKSTMIFNDIGWFFNDVLEETEISSDTIFPDFTLKDPLSQSVVYSQLLYLGRKKETYFRSYTKIQEVFAAIGGFAKFFYISINLFYIFTMNIYRNLFLLSSLHLEYEGEKQMEQSGNFKINLNNMDELQKNTILNNSMQNKLDVSQLGNLIHESMTPNFNKDCVKNNFFNYVINNKNEKTSNSISSNKYEQTNFTFKKHVNKYSYENNPKISFFQYVKFKICSTKHKNKLEQNYLENFDIYRKFFEKSLDVLTFFEFQHQFKLLIKRVLDRSQRQDLKLIRNPIKIVPPEVEAPK